MHCVRQVRHVVPVLVLVGFSVLASTIAYADYLGKDKDEGVTINRLLSYPGKYKGDVIVFRDFEENTEFTIYYGHRVDVNFLTVELDGQDITDLFHPVELTSETVILPVTETSHRLKLQISNRAEAFEPLLWDIDEFEIKPLTPDPGFHLEVGAGLVDWDRLKGIEKESKQD